MLAWSFRLLLGQVLGFRSRLGADLRCKKITAHAVVDANFRLYFQ